MLITKIIAQWILPPGAIVLLLFVGLLAWRRGWGKAAIAAASLLLLLLAMPPVKDQLMRPLEFANPPFDAAQLRPDDAIVVLGGGVNAHAPEYNGRDFLSQATLMRAAFALSLTKQSAAELWVSGGMPLHDDQQPEGEVMRRWLLDNGVAPARVHAENHSNNTWQNAMLLNPLLLKAGVRRVVLVTTAWHMPRAVWCFRQQFQRNGIVVVSAPCDYSSSQRPYTMLDWMPDAGTFSSSVFALHEYLGLFYYRLRYGVHYRV
ncbi:MAG: YdcF family protein [Mariprofundales bacterium]